MSAGRILGGRRETQQLTTLDNAGPLLATKLYVPKLRRGLVARTAESVHAAFERVGAHDVLIAVDLVDAISRTALGKAPLIRRDQLATAAH